MQEESENASPMEQENRLHPSLFEGHSVPPEK